MKTTQEQLVRHHLTKYPKLSAIEAFHLYGITRLSHIIFKLRRKGWAILTENKNCKTRQGNPTTVAIYKLLKK
tara:strand:+ start:522 stop:740 length:219 start_codon:yes stop_codon:yes gene_type:complete